MFATDGGTHQRSSGMAAGSQKILKDLVVRVKKQSAPKRRPRGERSKPFTTGVVSGSSRCLESNDGAGTLNLGWF